MKVEKRDWSLEPMGENWDMPKDGVCRGCSRHCLCPKECDGPHIPPANILKVDWVQLKMPDTVERLMVNLPAQYLMRDEEQRVKMSARYRIFDDEIVGKIIKELDDSYPTMRDYELGKKDIGEHYLYNVKGYGRFLIKSDCDDFKARADRFQAMLGAIGEKLRAILRKYKDKALRGLFDALERDWNALGYRWWGDRDAWEIFFADMSPIVDKVIKEFRPKIEYPMYELIWEMRINSSFRLAVKQAFRRWIEDNGSGVNWLLNTPELPEPRTDENFSENL